MTRAKIEAIVRAVFETALQRRVVPGEDVQLKDESGWDSVKQIELLFLLEEALGFTFLEEDISELVSLETVVNKALARAGAVTEI